MLIKKWDKLPIGMQKEEIRPYWELLRKKNFQLFIKRVFDIVVSGTMLILLAPIMLCISLFIVIDSKGGVFYRQERVTQNGKVFRIYKFRTMVANADKKGSLVTTDNDSRITKVGSVIRKYRLDEISQLIDVFRGKMTFVGTRPEVLKYVNQYQNEYYATLLLPAGVTSMASIMFKDEDKLLSDAENVDSVYINEVLPQKMKWNLEELKKISLIRDLKIMFMTVFAVLRKKEEVKGND